MDNTRKKEIILQSLNLLMKEYPELYYNSAKDIALIIYDSLRKDNDLQLSKDEKEEMLKLSIEDIFILLSYKD